MAFGENATLQDNANRANGNVSTGSTFFANKALNASGATSVVTNGEKFATTGDQNVLSASTWGPDVEYYCTLSTLPTQYLFLSGRITSGNSTSWNGYGVLYGPAVGEVAQLRRYAAGSNTTIESSGGFAMAAGDKLGLSIIGTKITAWWWRVSTSAWQEVVSKTDATYSAAGNLGWWAGDSTGRYDDVFAGTVSSGTKLVVPAAAKMIFIPSTPAIKRILAAQAAALKALPATPNIKRSATASAATLKAVPPAPSVHRAASAPAAVLKAAPATPSTARAVSTPAATLKLLPTALLISRALAPPAAVIKWLSSAPTTSRRASAPAALLKLLAATPAFATSTALSAPAAVIKWIPGVPASKRSSAAPRASLKLLATTPATKRVSVSPAARLKLIPAAPTAHRAALAQAALIRMTALAPIIPGPSKPIPEPLLPNTATIGQYLVAAIILGSATSATLDARASRAVIELPHSKAEFDTSAASADFDEQAVSAIVTG